MILLIDNYDSFVYNLARYLQELGQETRVVRNNRMTLNEIRMLSPQAIVISPGPCTPSEAGISIELVQELSDSIPMLGICLGHQAIAAALGGKVLRSNSPQHGKTSDILHDGSGLFEGIPSPLKATRYHSLVIEENSLPAELRITARTSDAVPMGIEHRSRPLLGLQFHPESVLTEHGHRLLANFLHLARIEIDRETLPAGDFINAEDLDYFRTTSNGQILPLPFFQSREDQPIPRD